MRWLEGPGFVVNKLLIPMINDAIGLVESGTASVEDIDKAMRLAPTTPWVLWPWATSSAWISAWPL